MSKLSNRTDGLVAYRMVVASCFLALLLSFASLALGAAIQNHDFSHISVTVHWALSAFLIMLSVAGFASVHSLSGSGDVAIEQQSCWAGSTWLSSLPIQAVYFRCPPMLPDSCWAP